MAELLLELLSEEIPARMQAQAAEDLRRLVEAELAKAGLTPTGLAAHVTPRRLALVAEGLPLRQADVSEERRGPRVGAPDKAIEGFLKSAGLASLDACEQRDTGKGVFWFAVINRPGGETAAALPAVLAAAIAALPWPKSMRWARHEMRWVRPLHSVLALFDGRPLAGGLRLGAGDDLLPFGAATRGHRFLAPAPFTVTSSADYRDKLRAAKVILDRAERRAAIAEQAAAAARAAGLRVKPDDGLLEEVTGLVEWPVALVGRIDDAFMAVPPEVLTTSMRTHQKYFALLDDAGRLAPRFLVIANQPAADGGAAIVAGNERVLRARLSDAKFFWDQDRRTRLEARVPALASIVFHARLGTVADKVTRLQTLAAELAPRIPGADVDAVRSAALLAKADLTSGMVGEFPELQGVMGRYYALGEGEAPAIAEAIAEHYAPLGPGDRCPSAPVSVAVALADKLDSLVGFFAIGERPTGSKDPFALRRAALGVIRLILENRLRLPLAAVLGQAFQAYRGNPAFAAALPAGQTAEAVAGELLDFFADRLKVALREKGVRHDLIAAVFALGGEDDLVRLLARVDALGAFLASEDGANLLTAYKRASNIVRIEEKRDGLGYDGPPAPDLFVQEEERILGRRLDEARQAASAALAEEDFSSAMAVLAQLRGPVDNFFDRVTVNVAEREPAGRDDVAQHLQGGTQPPQAGALRANRLRLLSQIRSTLGVVADFAKIEG
jgi:glycyl-tRNA synthetase beta chain